ncbi:hypothetical protein [Acrocarpospora corrugata]|nr:hypothetical protein [Acrocarpospora corrugata]
MVRGEELKRTALLRAWDAVISGGDPHTIYTLVDEGGPFTPWLESGEEAEVTLTSHERLQGSGPPPCYGVYRKRRSQPPVALRQG